ncbi:MAG: phosphatidylglycerophosphatase A [Spirochaetes bacterium]|nr:phosphatidylglycerophosphatase A [Spirochaetota bacterium]
MKIRKALFTALYTGYSPVAPGTVGTLLAVLIYVGEYLLFGERCRVVNAAVVAVSLYPAVLLCGAGEKHFGVKDPSQVVLDEVLGYWVSVLFHPFSWHMAVGAFFVFRFMDIVKPYPAGSLQKIRGGAGILIDDLVAGVYTNIIMTAVMFLIGMYRLPVVF